MTTTRRSFLGAALGAGVAAPLLSSSLARTQPAPRKLELMILGGTGFLGPAIVDMALRHGHSITLFNRGKTNPQLFPELQKLRGDRDKGELDALHGRKFDAIIDTSAYVPAHVEATAKLFAETARHYTLVSSISVYPEFGEVAGEIDEEAAVATVSDDVIAEVKTIRQSFQHYGAMKALCEQAAEKVMPGRVANIRPGLIVGPRDNSDRFTWWPVRVDRGGEILGPGDRGAVVQIIDVRDLAAWIMHCIEQQIVGVYNATGPLGKLTMEELLHGCKCATATPCSFTWVTEEFLKEQKVGPWMEAPLWIPREGRSFAKVDRAVAKGLEFRPVADTIRDTLQWAKKERGDKPFTRTGIKPEKEARLLAEWHARQK